MNFDASRSSLVYRTYDVDKYPLTEEDKQEMLNRDEAGRLEYVQKEIDALSEEKRNYYTLKETRPVNYSFNSYIYTGRNDTDFHDKHFDLEEKIKEVSCSGIPTECKKIGELARATRKEKYRFADCENLTDLQNAGFKKNEYGNFDYNLMSLTDPYAKFNDSDKLVSFSSDLPCLTHGTRMFMSSPNMTSFTGTFPKLSTADDMFYGCSLSKYSLGHIAKVIPVTSEAGLFVATTGATSFDPEEIDFHNNVIEKGWKGFLHYSDARLGKTIECGCSLKGVTSAYKMFYGNSLVTSITGNLDSLEYGIDMFKDCKLLSKFNMTTPKLKNAAHMFEGCSSLQTLDLDLSSLETADDMFYNCKLNKEGVNKIASTIKDWTNDTGEHNITLSVKYDDKDAFNAIVDGYETIRDNNWNVLLHNKYV